MALSWHVAVERRLRADLCGMLRGRERWVLSAA